jgi:hypothetical protein
MTTGPCAEDFDGLGVVLATSTDSKGSGRDAGSSPTSSDATISSAVDPDLFHEGTEVKGAGADLKMGLGRT